MYNRLAGYEDTNDAERLADDPTMRVVVGDRGIDRPAASTNTMSRFETEVLTQDGNVEGLGRLNAKWVDGAMSRTPHRRVILDMDSSESPVHRFLDGCSRECWIVSAGYRRRQAEGGYNHDLAKRGRAFQGVGLSSMRFHPTGGGPEDDKDGQEAWFTARIASLIG